MVNSQGQRITTDGHNLAIAGKPTYCVSHQRHISCLKRTDVIGVLLLTLLTSDYEKVYACVERCSWYYNKTGGLWGTYDNEPANDMMTSDNTLASNVETLADSWTVGRRCRPVNRAVIARHDTDSPRYKACTQLFNNETSPFRTCYRIVNPEPFLTMCLNDDAESTETDVCRIAASYVHECRRLEVHLRMPKQCGQYNLQSSLQSCVCMFTSFVCLPPVAVTLYGVYDQLNQCYGFHLVLPERDYVTFGHLLLQIRLSSVCLSVYLSVTFVHPTQGAVA